MNFKYTFGLLFIFQIFFLQPSHSSEIKNDEAEALYDKAWGLLEVNLDSARKYAELQKKLAIDTNYELGLIKAYYAIGFINYLQNNFDDAVSNYMDGLKLASNQDSREYKTRKMLLLHNLAVVYIDAHKTNDAITYTLQSLELAKELERNDNIPKLYLILGTSHAENKDYQNALKWFKKAERHLSQFPNDDLLARINNYMGIVYNKTAQYDKAKEHYLIALKIASNNEKIKDHQVYYVSNIGEVAFIQGDIEQAIFYYQKAYDLAVEFNNIGEIKFVANNLGDAYLKKNEYPKAIQYYEKSLSLGKKKGIDEQYTRASKNIAIAYEKLADYENSLTYQKQLFDQSVILHSTLDRLTAYRLEMKEMEWVEEHQKQQSKLETTERVIFWFKILISVVVILFIYAAYKAIQYYRGIRSGIKSGTPFKSFYIEELTQKVETLLENLKGQPAPIINHAINGGNYKTDLVNEDFHDVSQEFNLTKREIEISGLIAEGRTQQQIADFLHISSKTVSKHVQNIYSKTGVSNKVELLRKLNSIK